MKNIIITAIVSIMLCSCGEFLKPSSPNEYVPKTVEALDELLIGEVYPSPLQATGVLFIFNEFFSDNVSTLADPNADFKLENIETQAKAKRIYGMSPDIFDKNANNGAAVSSDTWQNHFRKIMACNTIFDYIDNMVGDNNIRNRVIAEAHLFRAFYYFNFVNIYGKPYNYAPDSPGVPIKLTSQFNPELMKRNTVREVYEQIISDLDAAERYYSNFDDDYFIIAFKPSAPLLYALRSRVALYMEDWQSAKKYAEKVMESRHRFKLYNLNDYSPSASMPNLSYTNVDNIKSEVIYVYSHTQSTTNMIDPQVHVPKKTGVNQTNKDLPLRYFVASPELLNLYSEGDLRKDLYINLDYCTTTPMIGPIKGYYRPVGKINTNSQNNQVSGSKDFGFAVRLSEVYLNYAEACAKLGGENKQLAIDAMNQLLSNRYDPNSNIEIGAADDEQLIEFIRTERRKELCYEGHRWFDQRRYGMKGFRKLWYEKGEVSTIIEIKDNDPAFTIKLDPKVIENNPRLVQNDEWSIKY